MRDKEECEEMTGRNQDLLLSGTLGKILFPSAQPLLFQAIV